MTRPRHPLEGRRLQVIGAMRRLGRDELLIVLPDGSKTLMRAAWTDRDTTTANDIRVPCTPRTDSQGLNRNKVL